MAPETKRKSKLPEIVIPADQVEVHAAGVPDDTQPAYPPLVERLLADVPGFKRFSFPVGPFHGVEWTDWPNLENGMRQLGIEWVEVDVPIGAIVKDSFLINLARADKPVSLPHVAKLMRFNKRGVIYIPKLVVRKVGSEFRIEDGSHRAAAMILSGETVLKAWMPVRMSDVMWIELRGLFNALVGDGTKDGDDVEAAVNQLKNMAFDGQAIGAVLADSKTIEEVADSYLADPKAVAAAYKIEFMQSKANKPPINFSADRLSSGHVWRALAECDTIMTRSGISLAMKKFVLIQLERLGKSKAGATGTDVTAMWALMRKQQLEGLDQAAREIAMQEAIEAYTNEKLEAELAKPKRKGNAGIGVTSEGRKTITSLKSAVAAMTRIADPRKAFNVAEGGLINPSKEHAMVELAKLVEQVISESRRLQNLIPHDILDLAKGNKVV